MSEANATVATNISAMKDKLIEEFEKMSKALQEEKDSFEKQMVLKRKEFDSLVKVKLDELEKGRKELDNAKDQLQNDIVQSKKEIEEEKKQLQNDIVQSKKEIEDEKKQLQNDISKSKKEIEDEKVALDKKKNEVENEKKSYTKKVEDQISKKNAEELEKINQIDAKAKELEQQVRDAALQKKAIEDELKSLQQANKKEEDLHLQKIAAIKKELGELEDELSQKLFLVRDRSHPDYTKKSRELIIKTVTGDTYRGNINIGSNERVSDMFTQVKTPFVVMYDAMHKGETNITVVINKQSIVSIRPLDDVGNPPAEAKSEG